jgi:membrane protein DedA with SNARE-associated domain
MIDDFIARWGYLAVGMGTFIEGETVLIAAGALARKGLLAVPLLLACAVTGSALWSQLWFRAGRGAGGLALRRWPRWQIRAEKFESFTARHDLIFLLGFRFVAGMGTICPALFGASGYSARRYVALDLFGAIAWASAFTGIGWCMAAGLSKVLGRNVQVPEVLTGALTVGGLFWLGTQVVGWLQRNRSRPAE